MTLPFFVRCAFQKCTQLPFVSRRNSRREWFCLCREHYELIEKCADPNVETCDCEAPCSCQYPEGWIELVNLKYHLLGMAVGAEEDLVGGLDENLYRNNQTEPVGTDS